MQHSRNNLSFNVIYHNGQLEEKGNENYIQLLQQNYPSLNISNFNKLSIVGERSLSRVYMTHL